MFRHLGLVMLTASLWSADGQSVPAEPLQAERLKALHEIYTTEYGPSTGEARATFARTLLNQGLATVDDQAARFVFFREAINQAIKAGDIETGRAAVDALAMNFVVPADEERLRFYAGAVANVTTVDQARLVIDAELTISDAAVARDDYELAARAIAQADSLARRLKDAALPVRTRMASERVKDLAAQYNALGSLTDVLGQMQPSGHSAYGRFLALAKHDWPAGLAHLVQGADVDLKTLATAELAATSSEAYVAAADGWWDWAQKQKNAVKSEAICHALQVYQLGQPGLNGLARARVDKRIAEAMKLTGSVAVASWPIGAVLMLTFENATSAFAVDLSPNRFKAVISGAIPERGAWGTALRFDGAKDVVIVVNAPALQTTANMTLAMWLKPSDLQGRRNPWHKCFGAEGTWTLEGSDGIAFFCGSSGTDVQPYGGCTMEEEIQVDEWVHVASVRDTAAETITWYKNGKAVVTEATKYASTAPSNADIRIGNGYVSGFAGLIDDVGLWPRALSAAEIATLYEVTSGGRK